MKKVTNFLIFIISFFLTSTSHGFTFDNLSKAEQIYKTNPDKAHSLLDEMIIYYENVPPRDYPWLAWAYSSKAYFYKEENKSEYINFRKKSCAQWELNYSEWDRSKVDEGLEGCYYYLQLHYEDDLNFIKAIEYVSERQKIFHKYSDFKITENSSVNNYFQTYSELSRYYLKINDYDNALLALQNVIKKIQMGRYTKSAALLYVDFQKELSSTNVALRNYSKALDDINSALKSLEELSIKNPTLHADMLSNKVHILTSLTKYNAALNINKKLEEIYQEIKINAHKYTNSIVEGSSEEFVVTIANLSLQSIYASYSNIYSNIDPIGNSKKALYYAHQIEKINEELPIDRKSTLHFIIRDDYYVSIGNNDLLIKNFNQQYKFVENQLEHSYKNENKSDIRKFHKSLITLKKQQATYYINQKNFNLALEILKYVEKKTNELTSNVNDLIERAQILNLFGRVYSETYEEEKAIEYYILALNILHKNNIRSTNTEEILLNNLAISYHAIGDKELAEKYIKDVLKSEEKYTELHLINRVKTYTNIATLVDDEETKLEMLERGYNIYKKYPEYRDLNYIHNLVTYSLFYEKRGDPKLAFDILNEGIVYAKANRSDINFVEFFRWHSYLDALLTKDSQYCIDTMENVKSLVTTKYNRYSPRLFRIYETLYLCYKQNNDLEKAYDEIMSMMSILALEFDKNNLDPDFKISRYLQDKKYSVHNFIIDSIFIDNNYPRYFDKYSEKGINIRSLALGLQQAVKLNTVSSNLTQSIIRQLSGNQEISKDIKTYKILKNKKNELLKVKSNNKTLIVNTNKLLDALDVKIEKLSNKIHTNYPEFKNNYSNQIVYPKDIMDMMDHDTAIIHMSMTSNGDNDSLVTTIITKDDVQFLFNKVNYIELKNNIKELRKSVSITNNQIPIFNKNSSSYIHNVIFPNIMKPLIQDKTKLIIIPDGILYSIPFDILYDYDLKKWILETYTISTYPNLFSFYALNKNIKFANNNKFLGLGNPLLNSKSESKNNEINKNIYNISKIYSRGGLSNIDYLKLFPELPETEIELKKISAIFDDSSKLFLKDQFNESLIKRLSFNDYKVVSFATHALVVGEIEGLEEPAIVLSLPEKATAENDGLLTSSEIIRLNFDNDLIILSACNTASSDGKLNSNALSGLANSFFYAGTRSILVTHWSVISESAVDLMVNTFSYLDDDNADISVALRDAKLKMLSNEKTAHPIHWGPYTLIGRSKLY
jgi:CHAT domain-containing protein/tetratricopeptide (TPR) repeat protein